MYDVLIKNGKIVSDDRVYQGDIAIKDEKIAAILISGEKVKAEKIIDAEGKYVFPGAIDCHVHFNEPGYTWREDFRHGSSAAAVGGTTTVIDMPLQNTPPLIDREIFKAKKEAIEKNSVVDYAFWGGVIEGNLGEIKDLNEEGVVAFKSFISPTSPDYSSLNMGLVRDALKITKEIDSLIGFHCEDYSIIKNEENKAIQEGRTTREDYLLSRPVIAELISTQNIIALARENDAKVHICHVSHPEVAEEIRKAQQSGVRITAETCSHYLVYTEDDLIKNGMLFKCAPPLRKKEARDKLWEYVIDGTLSCIGSDHSPSTLEEKSEETNGAFGAWGGISGVQSLMQVMFDQAVNKKGLSPTFISKTLSYGPSKVFGLSDKKGKIECGYDADLVILDAEKEWEITNESLFYLNKISAFIGLKGKGTPIYTLIRGKIVAENGKVVEEFGYGKLIKKK